MDEWTLNLSGRYWTRCRADCDDHCEWSECPQLRDGEPKKSGRHCPLDSEDFKRAEEWR